MPTPKRKLSRKRRDQRAANKGLKYRSVMACLTCYEPIAPHQVCKGCGHYKGQKILRTKLDRSYDRTQVRTMREQRAHGDQPIQASSHDSSSDTQV